MFEKTPIGQLAAEATLNFDDHRLNNQLFLA